MRNATDDPYLYPGTRTLKNRKNIRDAKELQNFESQSVLRRYLEARQHPIPGNFDTSHLKAIHRRLFQDVYDWAGQFRVTPLGKEEFIGGPVTWFTAPGQVSSELDRVYSDLVRIGFLQGLTLTDFATRAASLFVSIFRIHPFRQGNGRAQRLFLDHLGQAADHELNFDVVSEERMIRASVDADRGDISTMRRLFTDILDPERYRALRAAVDFLEKADKRQFDWNKAYIAFTMPGQHYAGVLVGRQGDAFMMRNVIRGHVVVGRQSDIPENIRSGERLEFTAAAEPPSHRRKRGRSR
jgi:cell filamentation protein